MFPNANVVDAGGFRIRHQIDDVNPIAAQTWKNEVFASFVRIVEAAGASVVSSVVNLIADVRHRETMNDLQMAFTDYIVYMNEKVCTWQTQIISYRLIVDHT